MLPVLKVLAEYGARPRRDITDAVARMFNLTDEERQKLLPSGKIPVILSRVGWALSYMKQARLVEPVKRGVYKLTDRGREVLASNVSSIDADYLERYPEFRDFQNRTRESAPEATSSSDAGPGAEPPAIVRSPEEALEAAYSLLRSTLQAELLDSVKAGTPGFFEELVIDLLVKMGYGGSRPEAARSVGKTGDGGIDGVIDEDRLGLDVIYVQAKRWEGTVGRPEIQKFAGALQGQRAKRGIFITTSSFSREAEEYAQRIDNRIVLIDGERLATLLFDYDVGVNPRSTYVVKHLDSDYFEDT
ncbi:MAG: restriction endonuclease [Gemmatimonadota bacterium]